MLVYSYTILVWSRDSKATRYRYSCCMQHTWYRWRIGGCCCKCGSYCEFIYDGCRKSANLYKFKNSTFKILYIFFDNLTQEKFLTPEWIQQFKYSICSAPILMVDANLIPPALEASCQSTSKLFLSPIYLLTENFEFFTLPIIIDSPLFSYPYLFIS